VRSAIGLALIGTTVVMVVPIAASASTPTVTRTATAKCRSQTYTYVRGRKPLLSSVKGPHVRKSANGIVSLTDNQVTADYQPVVNGAHDPFLSVEPVNPQVTRIESVTLYPTKGKHKRYKITAHSSDEAYKYFLIKDYGQVQLPVSGDQGSRPTPVMRKVVVTAKENCFTSQ
jgi:hypothetical protein